MPPRELLQKIQLAPTQEKPVFPTSDPVVLNEPKIPVGNIDIGKLLVTIVTSIPKKKAVTSIQVRNNDLVKQSSHRNVDAASVVCGAICTPHKEYCTVTDRPDHTDHKCPQGCNF